MTKLDATWTFDLRVIARTLDPRNGAREVYTGHARTTWRWDASGTFQVGNDVNRTTTYNPTGGITAPGLWARVTGETPFSDGPAFNTLVEGEDEIWA